MGEQILVKESMKVDVSYGEQCHRNLKLLVVQSSGPSLMGRDWLKVVTFDWRKVGKVSASASLENPVVEL